MENFAIYVSGLSKRFGDVLAVDSVSFTVRPGELFGFLGPNGAGKTTTINMLTGLARPDTGLIRIRGIDCTKKPKAAQHLIGIVPDESNLYPELTGFKNLCFCAALYGLGKKERETRARELLNRFSLAQASDRKFASYSRGMKRKLTIAAGIIHKPEILFLDEPTTGIDVASARQLRQLILELQQSGTTIFLTTHYIEEAERLCNQIAFIVSGRIIRIDTIEHLMQPIQEKHVLQITCENELNMIQDNLPATFPELQIQVIGQSMIRAEATGPIHVGPLVRFLEDHGIAVTEARRIRPSLEDIFMQITGIDTNVMRKEKAGGSQ